MAPSDRQTQFQVSEGAYLVLAALNIVLFSGLSMAVHGYAIVGQGTNQISQLPIVLRALDPGYLPNDWYVNQMGGFSARQVFALVVSGLAKVVDLPNAYLLLQWSSVAMVGFVTFFVTRTVFRGDRVACLLASLLALVLVPFTLGNDFVLVTVRNGLVPLSLAQPMVLLAVAFALSDRPVLCGLLAATAALFQPLAGTIAGLLCLVTLLLLEFSGLRRSIDLHGGTRAIRLVRIAAGFGPIALVAAMWALKHQSQISDESLINIVAYVRNPHHFLPSGFGLGGYLKAVTFLFGFALVLDTWRRTGMTSTLLKRDRHLSFMLVYAALLLVLCLAGYVFVELVPVKEIVVLQAFRHLPVLLWFAIIVTALVTTQVLNKLTGFKRALCCCLLVMGNRGVEPFVFATGGALTRSWMTGGNRLVTRASFVVTPFLLVCGLVYVGYKWPVNIPFKEIALTVVLGIVTFMSVASSRIVSRSALFVVPVIFVAGVSLFQGVVPVPGVQSALRDNLKFNVTFDDVAADPRNTADFQSLVDLGAFARDHLPADTIVLTPPNFGAFRIFARRAIVMDFKSWIFHDPGLWLGRLTDVYGRGGGRLGFALRDELVRSYADISDQKIRQVADKYGAGYAILHRSTRTDFPILFSTDLHKIARLRQP